MGNNRAQTPLEPASPEPARPKPHGLVPKGPRTSESHQRKSLYVRTANGPTQRRTPPHLDADISQSDRDALTGLPFS